MYLRNYIHIFYLYVILNILTSLNCGIILLTFNVIMNIFGLNLPSCYLIFTHCILCFLFPLMLPSLVLIEHFLNDSILSPQFTYYYTC